MPINPIVGGALVTGGLDLGSQLLSGGMSRRKAGRQYRHNQKLAEYSFDRQYDMWDEAWRREIEYNDPSAQMERYRKAGINPHMAYMSGGGQNTAQTGALPQYNQEANDVGGMDKIDLGGVVNSYFQTQMMDADLRSKKAKAKIDEIEAQKENVNLADKLGAIYHKNSAEYKKAIQDLDIYSNVKGLSQYQRRAKAQTSIMELEQEAKKVMMELQRATKSNLINNDDLIRAQTAIAEANADFVNSDTFKNLPKALRGAMLMLFNKM